MLFNFTSSLLVCTAPDNAWRVLCARLHHSVASAINAHGGSTDSTNSDKVSRAIGGWIMAAVRGMSTVAVEPRSQLATPAAVHRSGATVVMWVAVGGTT